MRKPLIIAHRGASGHCPEHTLASYMLAITMGADFIEPDLVATRDGVLVARHENALAIVDADSRVIEATTNVASRPGFATRLTRKLIDGRVVRGWFTEDFNLDELKTLRAVERLPHLRSTGFDGLYEIPSFDEILELAREASQSVGRPIGVYPETKLPGYFASLGLPLEEKLIASLEHHGFGDETAPAFIQSFETSNLRQMARMTRIPLVQLVAFEGSPRDLVVRGDQRTFRDLLGESGLAEIASYAAALGTDKNLIIPRDENGFLSDPTTLVCDAHSAGLAVHAWTFRNENQFLPEDFQREGDRSGNAAAEYQRYFALGVDGVFSDHPDTAVAARDAM